MRLRPLQKAMVLKDPRKRMLADYLNALADLAHPKAALPILHDEARVLSYEHAIQEAVRRHEGNICLLFRVTTCLLFSWAAPILQPAETPMGPCTLFPGLKS